MKQILASLALSLTLAACQATPPVASTLPAPTGGDAPAPDTLRWTYGSGEAAATSIQAWRQLADYTIAVSRQRKLPQSVPMGLPDVPGGVASPSCQNSDGTQKPFAAVFDVDETVVLNRGYEYWQAYKGSTKFNEKEWDQWARSGASYVAPVPGAVTGIRRLREADIAVVFNTNRSASTAEGAIAAIAAAGLGPAVHGETLFLSGDDAMGSRKDGRRATIAGRYCVIALAGDNLGDFADVFNDKALSVQQRRELAARGEYARLWGAGWFALPNAAYGHWQKGSVDDVFPPDARWTPETAPSTAPAIMNEGN